MRLLRLQNLLLPSPGSDLHCDHGRQLGLVSGDWDLGGVRRDILAMSAYELSKDGLPLARPLAAMVLDRRAVLSLGVGSVARASIWAEVRIGWLAGVGCAFVCGPAAKSTWQAAGIVGRLAFRVIQVVLASVARRSVAEMRPTVTTV